MSQRALLRTRASASRSGAHVAGEGDVPVGIIAGVVVVVIVLLGFASASPAR